MHDANSQAVLAQPPHQDLLMMKYRHGGNLKSHHLNMVAPRVRRRNNNSDCAEMDSKKKNRTLPRIIWQATLALLAEAAILLISRHQS